MVDRLISQKKTENILVPSPVGTLNSGEVLWWAECVCVSVCPRGYLRNHTCDLYQFFHARCLWTWLGPPPAAWRNPKGKGSFAPFSSPLTMLCNAFAAKGIIRSPITSCCRRDHSVAAVFTANGIGREVHSAGEVWSTIALFESVFGHQGTCWFVCDVPSVYQTTSRGRNIVSWSFTSLFSTNTAISETRGAI